MRMEKRLSQDLCLTFHYDRNYPDEYCFVLKDEMYGGEIMLSSKEMIALMSEVMKMKRDAVL